MKGEGAKGSEQPVRFAQKAERPEGCKDANKANERTKRISELIKGYDEVRKMLISMINSPEKFYKK